MKILFKIKYLYILVAVLLPLAAGAAESGSEGKRVSPEERRARVEQRMAECKADPDKCRADRQARFEQRFKRADADGNGLISRAEAEKGLPRLAHHFDRIDANGDGQISRDEIAAVRKAHFEQRRGERKGPGTI